MASVLEPILLLPSVFKSGVLSWAIQRTRTGFRTGLQKDLPQLDDFGSAMYDGYRGRRDIAYESGHESSCRIWAISALYVTGRLPRQERGCILEARTGVGAGRRSEASMAADRKLPGFSKHNPPASCPASHPRISSADNTANNHGNNGRPTAGRQEATMPTKIVGHDGGRRNMIGQLPAFGQNVESARRPFNEEAKRAPRLGERANC